MTTETKRQEVTIREKSAGWNQTRFFRSDQKGPAYDIEKTDEYPAWYRIVRRDDEEHERGRVGVKETVVAKRVNYRWAKQFVQHKLDPSRPAPKKYSDVEKIGAKGGSRVMTSTVGELATKYGSAKKGLDLGTERPVLITQGLKEGIVSDGFMLLKSKEAAKDSLTPLLAKYKQEQEKAYRKQGMSDTEIAKKLDELENMGEYPKYQSLFPSATPHEYRPVGIGYQERERGVAGSVVWLANEKGQSMSVSSDKLAYALKYFPNAKLVSGEAGTTKDDFGLSIPLVLMVNGEQKGLIMPIYKAVPDNIREEARRPMAPPARPQKEPWEMTREEYKDAVLDKDPLQLVNLKPHWLPIHERAVASAVKEGKPVPAEVLKDYPELGKRDLMPDARRFHQQSGALAGLYTERMAQLGPHASPSQKAHWTEHYQKAEATLQKRFAHLKDMKLTGEQKAELLKIQNEAAVRAKKSITPKSATILSRGEYDAKLKEWSEVERREGKDSPRAKELHDELEASLDESHHQFKEKQAREGRKGLDAWAAQDPRSSHAEAVDSGITAKHVTDSTTEWVKLRNRIDLRGVDTKRPRSHPQNLPRPRAMAKPSRDIYAHGGTLSHKAKGRRVSRRGLLR